MKYEEARGDIKSGDVLLWSHRKWNTWYDIQLQLVRFFTRSEYSHIGIAYVMGDRVFVLESVGAGVRMYPLSKELPFSWMPMISGEWNDNVLKAAMAKFGQKYSKWDAIKSLWKKIPVGEDDQWQCAEYTSYILHQMGIPVDCRRIPGEIVYWLQNHFDWCPIIHVTE
jgi:hypothetical protein